MNEKSLKRLAECHPDIQKLAKAVDEKFPIECICGYRNETDQNKAFKEKKSKLQFPNSKHNKKPALAGDFIPKPANPKIIDWRDIHSFELMCLVFEQTADELGIKIRLGRDFSFKDYPHCELINEK